MAGERLSYHDVDIYCRALGTVRKNDGAIVLWNAKDGILHNQFRHCTDLEVKH